MTRQSITLDADTRSALRDPSRRDFVKRLGIGAAGCALAATLGESKTAQGLSPQSGGADGESDEAMGILIDLTRCSGCQTCALACKESNQRPQPEVIPSALDAGALSFVDVRTQRDGSEAYVKRQCMHCLHPACVSACTVGALRKTAEGPVVYDADKCIGCRYCQYACPFGVPTYEWDNPLGLIHKCEMCVDRLAEGGKPACVGACPNGALRFGKRKELLAQAKAQISSMPDRYLAHVYGEHEAGGTSMLYLSDVPFARLGFPSLDDSTISGHAETVMQLTPALAATVATLATGLHLIFRRRQLLAEQRAEYHLDGAHQQKEDRL